MTNELSDKLTDRLRGKYKIGPSGEFGERQFTVPAISIEAADRIEELEAKLEECRNIYQELIDNKTRFTDIRGNWTVHCQYVNLMKRFEKIVVERRVKRSAR